MRQLKIQRSITDRSNLSLNKYLTDVSSIKNTSGLSSSEEAELARTIRETADEKLRLECVHKLVVCNLRFVISIAKQYHPAVRSKGFELTDLINAGNIGLIVAAHRFDETRGFKFISYAVWWVRQAILEEVGRNNDAIRKPSNKINMFKKISNIERRLEQELHRPVDISELVAACREEVDNMHSYSMNDIFMIAQANKGVVSSDSFLGSEETEERMIDKIQSEGESELYKTIFQSDVQLEVDKVLKLLQPTERIIIASFFGLLGYEQKSLDEIAIEFSLSRERIRQIKEKAIRKLRFRRESVKHLSQLV